MQLKLNNSEVMQILTSIDDALGYDLEPLEKTTLMNILRKISGSVRDPINRCVDSFVVDIINTYKDDSMLTEEEKALVKIGR